MRGNEGKRRWRRNKKRGRKKEEGRKKEGREEGGGECVRGREGEVRGSEGKGIHIRSKVYRNISPDPPQPPLFPLCIQGE